MKKSTFATNVGFAALAFGMLATAGMTANNLVSGNAIERGLVVELADADAGLADCVAGKAAKTIQNGSMLRPGPMTDAGTLRAEAIAAARVDCAG